MLTDKPDCPHYLRWRDAPEPLQSEECWFLADHEGSWDQFCDCGMCESFEKKCPEALRWGHE